jgi:hypothetical protein
MADISQDAARSAAWMLMRRAREAGSASDRSDTSGQIAQHTQDGRQAIKDQAVKELIAAYLHTPTHIFSPFHSW